MSLASSLCQPGHQTVSFADCSSLQSTLEQCSTQAAGAPYVSCFCQQPLFDSIFDCANEQRDCFQNSENDAEASSLASLWHSVCDPRINFSPTTPAILSLSYTVQGDFCTIAAEAETSAAVSYAECQSMYTGDASQLHSCACDSGILSLAYTGEVLGNRTCLGKSGETSNMVLYSECSAEIMGLQTTTPTQPASVSAVSTTGGTVMGSSQSVSSTRTASSPTATRTSTASRQAEAVTLLRVWVVVAVLCVPLTVMIG